MSKEVVLLEITSDLTGYTIQALKTRHKFIHDYRFSDPAVVVPVFKLNIKVRTYKADGKTIDKEVIKGSFNVTRDSWYYLGNLDNLLKKIISKDYLLNREFVPDTYTKNLYGALWLPHYPQTWARAYLNAFVLTRFGSRSIPAKPLAVQKHIDGTAIDSVRANENLATDIMIHIGSTYSILSYDHLGGSYGCFAFIPEGNIYSSVTLAEQASIDDAYDDETSNKAWKEVCQSIINLAFEPNNRDIQVVLRERTDKTRYIPTRILTE